ncbi:MAG: FAD:protein FMN transferase [Bernardetiaceae bacterium]|jgi:thiamine biosynthesis lipoprotein|nr:FAD:protein FMN transferase [Bernardetiaceae bacterium]
MSNTRKNAVYSLILIALVAGVYFYRQAQTPPPPSGPVLVTLAGQAMGSTYNIRYLHPQGTNLQAGIDSLLEVFNHSLSTYEDSSDISRFNETGEVRFRYPFFYPVLERSRQLHQLTNGAFDPTVAPLVRAWGFGPKKGLPSRPPNVDSLRPFVDFTALQYDPQGVKRTRPGITLDFNAVAPGYGVDLVAELLRTRGATSYLVEIGGEVACRGLNERGQVWTVGISNPQYEEKGGEAMQAALHVRDQALATSGNYRRFYEKDGKRYAHTIDPKTGYPVQHNLLSATVLAPDCMTADALATAFMVMGTQPAIAFSEQHQIPVFLVYDDNGQAKTYTSPSLVGEFVKK